MIWVLLVILTNADGSLRQRVESRWTTQQECEAQLGAYEPFDSYSSQWIAYCTPRQARPHR